MRGATVAGRRKHPVYLVFQSTLLMRGATPFSKSMSDSSLFQSTLLMRGATDYHKAMFGTSKDFNPRSSCEERHVRSAYRPKVEYHFNPRSSCEERLDKSVTVPIYQFDFNPRSSCEERHLIGIKVVAAPVNFNPRSSCEERLMAISCRKHKERFQSTLLMRGATAVYDWCRRAGLISIHAPHARSDLLVAWN